jgi:hypothetical protein
LRGSTGGHLYVESVDEIAHDVSLNPRVRGSVRIVTSARWSACGSSRSGCACVKLRMAADVGGD